MFDYRVEKERREATLTLSTGMTVRGSVFVAARCAGHEGHERIKDLLNADAGFFPFEVEDDGGRQVALYHREHVVLVTLPTPEEPRQDPAYDVAVTRRVAMLLAGGTRLTGRVHVYRPPGRDRLSDYAHNAERFQYLEGADGTFIVNARYIVELRELGES